MKSPKSFIVELLAVNSTERTVGDSRLKLNTTFRPAFSKAVTPGAEKHRISISN